jgi:hypothetical protein
MIIEERKWKDCPSCGKHDKLLSEDVYGCDNCRKPIDINKKDVGYLDATVFRNNEPTEHLHFCSWRCVVKGLSKVKSDYFITLPILHYDNAAKGVGAKDFFKLLKPRRSQANQPKPRNK